MILENHKSDINVTFNLMLYNFFNVYPYYVINLALYLFAFEFILLIVMKYHIIWWCYVHFRVYNIFPGDG